ncbi:hypothetical protein VTH8203_03831 [Vibrio thalassae]|uniref:Uncharacterized protein n=1 Tax=Vibrio thalassae TaxID=1243014 RepID=A0A240ENE9_9VIBR|nr:hypothetical protein VTH8203_03831 [Vibrio thalassae]
MKPLSHVDDGFFVFLIELDREFCRWRLVSQHQLMETRA